VGALVAVGELTGPTVYVAVGKKVTVGLGWTGGGGVNVIVGITVKVGGEVGVGEGVDVFVGGGITRSMTVLHPINNTENKIARIMKYSCLDVFICFILRKILHCTGSNSENIPYSIPDTC
jgi:hypothetical protein